MFIQLLPFHPKLVHFPVALFVMALALDVLSLVFRKEDLHKAAVIIYVSAVLMTPIVVWSGLWEQQRLHLHHPVLTQHKTFALVTMWVSLASLPALWFLNKRHPDIFRIILLVVLLGMATTVLITGHWGGTMVYEYGAGVSQ